MSQNLRWTVAQYEAFRRKHPSNPPLAAIPAAVPEPARGPALDEKVPAQKKSRSSVGVRSKRPVLRITIIACRRPHAGRDSDNWAQTGYKELRDVIARWFGLDDNDHTISWQYRPIDTTGQQGTIVIAEPR